MDENSTNGSAARLPCAQLLSFWRVDADRLVMGHVDVSRFGIERDRVWRRWRRERQNGFAKVRGIENRRFTFSNKPWY